MGNFIEFLKDFSGIFTVLVLLLLLLVLLWHGKALQKTARENRQPYVVLYLTKLHHDESVNYFVLENFGQRAALNVAVRVNPDLKIEFPKDNEIPLFFENRISVLAPTQRIVSALPPGDYVDWRYDCTLTYQNDENQIFTRKQVLDFSFTKHLLFSNSPENKVAKNTEKMSQALMDISMKLGNENRTHQER